MMIRVPSGALIIIVYIQVSVAILARFVRAGSRTQKMVIARLGKLLASKVGFCSQVRFWGEYGIRIGNAFVNVLYIVKIIYIINIYVCTVYVFGI